MARTEDFVSGTGQLLFVLFWAGNDMKAARLAGFSRPKSDGSRCKQHPAVRRLLQLKQEAIALANVPKTPAPVSPNDVLNADELKFVCAWRGDAAEAALSAGLPESNGLVLLARPHVTRAICEKQTMLIASSIKAQFGNVPPITHLDGIHETPEGSGACSRATH
jgi:hypothetical protein